MNKIKLAALDVDGTLVRTDLSLQPNVIAAVQSLRDAGIEIGIATGRCIGELKTLREALPWIKYFIVSNGAVVLDTQNKITVYENRLPLSIAREIEREARRYSVMTEVYADGVSYLNRSCWEQTERYTAAFMHHPSLASGRVPVENVGDLLAARTEDVEKLYFTFEHPNDLKKLESFCRRFAVDLVVSIHDGLEVNQRGVEKGTGLRELCAYLNISLQETAAVGDGLADIAMFRVAGLSVAMDNAQAQVRHSAALVAPDNDSDGMVWAAEQIIGAE